MKDFPLTRGGEPPVKRWFFSAGMAILGLILLLTVMARFRGPEVPGGPLPVGGPLAASPHVPLVPPAIPGMPGVGWSVPGQAMSLPGMPSIPSLDGVPRPPVEDRSEHSTNPQQEAA